MDSIDNHIARSVTQLHFSSLRGLSCCRRSLLVLFVENNFGGGHLAGDVFDAVANKFGAMHNVSEKWDKPGVWTKPEVKVRNFVYNKKDVK